MSARVVATDLARDLAAMVGEKNVSENPAELRAAIESVTPVVAVSPGTPEEVADVLRFCNANDLVVAPAGGCTAQNIGCVPSRVDVLLRTLRLRQVEHYDPGDLTIGIGAGTTLAEVHEKLATHRQVLPITVPYPERSTIGGVLARAAQDPRRLGYGAVRDFCIGIRFVTPDGKIARAGGRVVKNVAGYDLMKLMIGSYGTLAVIVGASFKLFPQSRQTRTFAGSFQSREEAIAFRDRILRSQLAPHVPGTPFGGVAGSAQGVPSGFGGTVARLVACRRVRTPCWSATAANWAKASRRKSMERTKSAFGTASSALVPWPFSASPGRCWCGSPCPLRSLPRRRRRASRRPPRNGLACAIDGRRRHWYPAVRILPRKKRIPPARRPMPPSWVPFGAQLSRDGSAIVLAASQDLRPHLDLWGLVSHGYRLHARRQAGAGCKGHFESWEVPVLSTATETPQGDSPAPPAQQAHASHYTTRDRPTWELYSHCVHCGLCLPQCPTYRVLGLEADSPRGRILPDPAGRFGRLEIGDSFVTHLDRCLGCRTCETACPSGVEYGRILEGARTEIEANYQRPFLARVARNYAYRTVLSRFRSLRRWARLLRFYQHSGLQRLVRGSGILKLLGLEQVEALTPPHGRKLLPRRNRRLLSGSWGASRSRRPAGGMHCQRGLFRAEPSHRFACSMPTDSMSWCPSTSAVAGPCTATPASAKRRAAWRN